MSTPVALSILLAAAAYLGVSVAFGVAFAFRGAASIDPAARGAPLSFRLLIVPGAALLWPVLARRWARGSDAPPPAGLMRPLRNRHLALWAVLGPVSVGVLVLCVWLAAREGPLP
ncbi:MAG: hypothetical protein J0L61_02590 [Planctomycetes bacterium]|nr:hypothetical protein [Planctomycetota bacterium]